MSWLQRLKRQFFPRHDVRTCCYYHAQNLHKVSKAALHVRKQVKSLGLEGEEADEYMSQLLDKVELSEIERWTAKMLLTEGCGIQLWRPEDSSRWTYTEGRHRARAMMDAGVRRTVVAVEDDRRSDG